MSKFRTFLGGLAALGTLAVLVVGGVYSVSSSAAHPAAFRAEAAAVSPACVTCIGGSLPTE
jgi:hypothetical protein